jgi:hypothetical protein
VKLQWLYGECASSALAVAAIERSFPSVISDAEALQKFIAYFLYRVQLGPSFLLLALLMLDRLSQLGPLSRVLGFEEGDGSSVDLGSLFAAAYILAAKLLDEGTYRMCSWGYACRSRTPLMEMRRLEKAICDAFKWQLLIKADKFEAFVLNLQNDFYESSQEFWLGIFRFWGKSRYQDFSFLWVEGTRLSRDLAMR